MQKFIHIHAKCDSFEIFEQVPQNKAVRRLENIKKNFQQLKSHHKSITDKLSVKTRVVNPELNFH